MSAINYVCFGNPLQEYVKVLEQQTYLDSLLQELKSFPPPPNDSPESVEELKTLIDLGKEVSDDAQKLNLYKTFDFGLEDFLTQVMSTDTGIDKNQVFGIIKSIHDDVIPLLIKLKYHYQRIRPYQLAFYYKMSLYPYYSPTAMTPSYPSGHVLQSKLYCTVLGNTFPEFYKPLMQTAEDVKKSRMALGQHYLSDCTFADYVADCILNHPDFIKKYRL